MLVEGDLSQELSQLFINYTHFKEELIKILAKNLERGGFFLNRLFVFVFFCLNYSRFSSLANLFITLYVSKCQFHYVEMSKNGQIL